MSTCQHHWRIDPPNGPISLGVCRLCGAEKEFRNAYEGRDFGDFSVAKDRTRVYVPGDWGIQ